MNTASSSATKHDEAVKDAITNIAHLKAALGAAEAHEKDSVIARDKFLSDQLAHKGMSVLTDSESTDIARSIYEHILDAQERGWSVNASSAAPRTGVALGDAVRGATSADCVYRRLLAVPGNPDGFSITVYPHRMEHMNINVDDAADTLSAMFTTHLEAHCPDTIFDISVRRLAPEESEEAGAPRYLHEIYSIRRKKNGGWSRLNQVNGTERHWDHFDADVSVKSILLDCLRAKAS